MPDVIAAIATPRGEGAVGMLRLSGPGCRDLAASFLRCRAPSLAPRAATLATACADGRDLDRVLVTHFPAPHTYTGEEMLEITTHGSPYILSKLLRQACRSGARLAEPGEFSQRAFLNGRMDLAQAEAVCDLIRAKTHRAHRAALEQLQGGVSRRIGDLRRSLLDLLAGVEAGLDHPEEDIPELGAERALERLQGLQVEVRRLIESYRVGRLLTEGARIAIVGSPNVGKSSLLNALLKRERAIVDPAPGTTRDTIEEDADLHGLRAVLIDTAGLRARASGPVERLGMERTLQALESSDLVLLVLDGSRPLGAEEAAFLRQTRTRCLEADRPLLLVWNKSDLAPELRAEDLPSDSAAVKVSALRGIGIELLARRIARLLGADADEAQQGLLVTSLRHRQNLERTAESLDLARAEISSGEVAALHLREALAALGALTGESSPDEVLHTIFSKFCIGK
ncbi:MAG: tRNA uridine-5-carboxymethylaminomethyl(34) synthesis GTPase MnmE [Elusimicrobia bacterium]|nr:tRNA uridine-5-carboxymethylaminomethyl(34) synthesis GTPase MnmE [Elusimicrobiota bacterium]